MAMLKKALWTVLGTAAFAAAVAAQAHDVPGAHAKPVAGQEKLDFLQHLKLPDAAGKQGAMVTVTFAPGQESIPHVHPGSVFAYVLEGEIESQMEGEKPVRYKAGQSWYETPKQPHVLARNVSDTKPAKLLVWLMGDEGEALVQPVKK
jgi:quercetin dioxygenase-like cupin family protein